VVPRDTLDVQFGTGQVQAIAGDTVAAELELDLALGDGYAESLRVDIVPPFDPQCGPLPGTVAITAVSADADHVVATDNSGAVTLTPVSPGDVAVRVTARWTAADLGRCAAKYGGLADPTVEYTLRVRVRRPASYTLDFGTACADAKTKTLQSRAQVLNATFTVLDDAGERIRPANATTEQPLGVTLYTDSPDLAVRANGDRITGLVATGAGVLTIAPDAGPPVDVRVLRKAEITDVDLRFALPGVANTPTVLEDGQAYGEGGFGRTGDRVLIVVASLRAGDDTLCTTPIVGDFNLSGTTPDTCLVHDPSPFVVDKLGLGLPQGTTLDVSAHVVGDGACALSLGTWSGGPSRDLSVTFQRVDTLLPVP